MRNDKERKRPDFRETCQVFIVLALFLGAWPVVHDLLPGKFAPEPAQVTTVTYRWGRGEGRAASSLFRITGQEKIPVAEQRLPEKLKPFFYYPMDINRVSADLLQTIPGIGVKLAGRIILFRQKNGHLRQLDGLARVEGIGPGKLAGLEKYLTCDSPSILLK